MFIVGREKREDWNFLGLEKKKRIEKKTKARIFLSVNE